jgi:hypothetical protein
MSDLELAEQGWRAGGAGGLERRAILMGDVRAC